MLSNKKIELKAKAWLERAIDRIQNGGKNFQWKSSTALVYFKFQSDTTGMFIRNGWQVLFLLVDEHIRLTLFGHGVSVGIRLLDAVGAMTQVPRPRVSNLRVYLSTFYSAVILGRRNRRYDELTSEQKEYIQKNETPDEKVRENLSESLGLDFKKIADKLKRNGVVILPKYVKDKKLRCLQKAYETEILKKKPNELFKIVSVNAAVDKDISPEFLLASLEVGLDPYLQAIIYYHFGQSQQLSGIRGYRQYPLEQSLSYRAWDYHNDLKAQGPYGEIKIMVLLNNVPLEGQGMRYAMGSHQNHWHEPTLGCTKYSIEEAIQFATEGFKICWGDAGTIVIFDTNGIHAGHRNASCTRDVLTISFAPATPDCPAMFNLPTVDKIDNSKCTETIGTWGNILINDDKLDEKEIQNLKTKYENSFTISTLKDRYSSNHTLTFFQNFLIRVASQDINADLDLELNVVPAVDKDRDIQLVEFRDVSPTHPQYQRIKNRLLERPPQIKYNVDIDTMIFYADTAGKLIGDSNEKIVSCAKFSLNLKEAFTHIDSIQRLRTMMIYLYFTLDKIQQIMEENSYPKDPLYKDIMLGASQLLDMYASLVFLDDLDHELNEEVNSPSQEVDPQMARTMRAPSCP